VKDFLIYEQPINKRIRAMMRLDLLFEQLNYFKKAKNAWDSTCAINIVNDILAFLSRTDIKTEVIKELERQHKLITQLEKNPDVNLKKTIQLLEEQKSLASELHAIKGAIGSELQQNIILNSAKQKSVLPGSSGNFDSPLFMHWINLPSAERTGLLEEWCKPFETIQNAVSLSLKVIRDSGNNTELMAEKGFYQDNLDLTKPYQMIRVAIPKTANYFPEISAGKHRFSIRFMSCNNFNRNPEQVQSDVSFLLCNCCF
jgi:cell division protein ZapD